MFMVDLGRVDGKRKRRAFYGWTAEEVEAKGRATYPDLQAPRLDRPINLRSERMRAAKALGTHTRQEWYAKLRALDFRCYYCQRDTRHPAVKLTKDHLTPVSRGGSDAIDNVVPACRSCNYDKADMTEAEYALMFWRKVV